MNHALGVFCWVAVVSLLSHPLSAKAQDGNPVKVAPLRGLKAVSVVVVGGDGYDLRQLKVASELQLRKSGVVVRPKGLPVVEVNLHAMEADSGFVVATLSVSVNDSVTFSNGAEGVAVVWRDFMTLCLDASDGDVDTKIEKRAAKLLDGLSNDILAANGPLVRKSK